MEFGNKKSIISYKLVYMTNVIVQERIVYLLWYIINAQQPYIRSTGD